LMVALLARCPECAFAFSEFHVLGNESRLRPAGPRSSHPAGHAWGDHFAQKFAPDDLVSSIAGLSHPTTLDIYLGDIYGAALHRPWVLPSAALIRRSHMEGLSLEESDSTWGDSELFAL